MKKTVLIFDDDPDIVQVTKKILNDRGYKVAIVEDCTNVFEIVEEYQPDIILMDLWIPTLGGELATQMLKNNVKTKHIPVIIFSANAEISKYTEKAGADGFLAKPFDIETLEKTINTYVPVHD